MINPAQQLHIMINPATALHKCQDQATGSVFCIGVQLQSANSLEDTASEITMLICVPFILLTLDSFGYAYEDRIDIKGEIDVVNNEAENAIQATVEESEVISDKIEKDISYTF